MDWSHTKFYYNGLLFIVKSIRLFVYYILEYREREREREGEEYKSSSKMSEFLMPNYLDIWQEW